MLRMSRETLVGTNETLRSYQGNSFLSQRSQDRQADRTLKNILVSQVLTRRTPKNRQFRARIPLVNPSLRRLNAKISV